MYCLCHCHKYLLQSFYSAQPLQHAQYLTWHLSTSLTLQLLLQPLQDTSCLTLSFYPININYVMRYCYFKNSRGCAFPLVNAICPKKTWRKKRRKKHNLKNKTTDDSSSDQHPHLCTAIVRILYLWRMVAGHQVVQQLLHGGEHQVAHQFLQRVVDGAQETGQACKDLAPLSNLSIQGFASWTYNEPQHPRSCIWLFVHVCIAWFKNSFQTVSSSPVQDPTSTCTYTHMHARTHARTPTHSLTPTPTHHTHAHTHTYITQSYTYTRTHAYAPTHMHTHNLYPQLHTNMPAHTAESSNPQINQPQERRLNLTRQCKQISLRVLLSSFLLGSVLAPFFCACPRCTMLLLAAGGWMVTLRGLPSSRMPWVIPSISATVYVKGLVSWLVLSQD